MQRAAQLNGVERMEHVLRELGSAVQTDGHPFIRSAWEVAISPEPCKSRYMRAEPQRPKSKRRSLPSVVCVDLALLLTLCQRWKNDVERKPHTSHQSHSGTGGGVVGARARVEKAGCITKRTKVALMFNEFCGWQLWAGRHAKKLNEQYRPMYANPRADSEKR
ncbi:hypothetical protein FN846DRAFT_28864 [Sphaerosporella brunnea]|uniref:Uncharacterized protein n=1 Tax=Sphaerosporella brunnea TaxID=1250544 RepID=A0A5J5EVB8_9PEZI|nr:hypothetical protein FN846DRAFT_28864 [Sphaerosporella brunnea]